MQGNTKRNRMILLGQKNQSIWRQAADMKDTEMYKASLPCVTSKGCGTGLRTRSMASAISRASHCADAKPLIPHKAPVAAQRLPQEAEALPVHQKHPAVDAGHLLSPSVTTSRMGGHPFCGRLKGRHFLGVPNEQTNESKQKDKHTGSLCGCLLFAILGRYMLVLLLSRDREGGWSK